jgi:hypothetical protein
VRRPYDRIKDLEGGEKRKLKKKEMKKKRNSPFVARTTELKKRLEQLN